jgi:hypothetical protein
MLSKGQQKSFQKAIKKRNDAEKSKSKVRNGILYDETGKPVAKLH